MSKFKISIYAKTFKDRLVEAEMKAIDSFIADKSIVVNGDNCAALMSAVGKRGCVFCPSTFKDSIKSRETFEQAQLFVLTFDNASTEKISFNKIKGRARYYGLPILFAYSTDPFYWTDPEREQFSIVFLNETPLSDLKEAEAMQRALMVVFPEAAKDCSVLNLYQGGDKLLYSNEAIPTINAEWLFMNMCLYLKDRFGPTNYKRKIAEFSRATGVRLDDRSLPDVSIAEVHTEYHREKIDDKNSSKCIIEERSDEILSHHEFRINFESGSTSEERAADHERSPTISPRGAEMLKLFSSSCRLYQDFQSGFKRLTQQELLGLATNLSQVKSGQKVFKAVLGSEPYDEAWGKRIDNWDYYFYYIKGKGSTPCTCFCPYRDTCHHGTDILSTAKPKYHQIERIDNWGVPLVDVDEAWEDFSEKFQEAVTSDEPGWHIIKSQTALGKTQALLEFLRDTSLRVLVAVPTNNLKREVCERAKKMEVEVVASPSLHELQDEIPTVVWCEIQALYDAGKSPMPRVEKAIAEDDVECAKIFKKYKRELSEFINFEGHAITTHRRLTNMDVRKYDLVIVDEDIIYSTVIPNRETVSLSMLKKVRKKLAASDPLAAKIKRVLKKVKDSEFFILDEVDWHRAYADIKMAVNIPALCSATHFCYRAASKQESDLTEDSITFIKPVKFPDSKYIMLSATADEDICKYYFGEENVRFYDCKEATITGLHQYGDKPMGRSSIRKDPSIIKRIKQWTRFDYTISFKEFHKYYEGELHFGNCAGCDTLKGKNIDVIGTPHQPEWIYKLFAYSLGYDVDDSLKPNTVVVHNGFRFRFMTYADETLRAIQFYMIESELEQAVGRARLLRCDCTVNLFSDFPLKQAVIEESEYDSNEGSPSA